MRDCFQFISGISDFFGVIFLADHLVFDGNYGRRLPYRFPNTLGRLNDASPKQEDRFRRNIGHMGFSGAEPFLGPPAPSSAANFPPSLDRRLFPSFRCYTFVFSLAQITMR